MKNKTLIILSREYLQRVRRKSFIITTILMPILMVGLMMLPALIDKFSDKENKVFAVIDDSGAIAPALQNTPELKFVSTDASEEELRKNEDYDGILIIGKSIIDNPSDVTLYSRGALSPQSEMIISSQIGAIIEQYRLTKYNIENLPQILAEVHADVNMKTLRIDEDEDRVTSTIVSSLVGMLMSLVLYMFVLIYGQMVMTSIIEEKNNRVLEVVVSSVSPSRLMLGKILGIGAVAVTQIVIWALLICSFTTWVMPSMLSSFLNAGTDIDLMQALTMLGDTGYILNLFVLLTLLLVGGYLFYSAIYAAIGSAVDNIQDASQLQTVAVIPIILGMVFSMSVINDPNSTLAFWLSMIPFTSPMVMMARIPFGIPAGQIVASLAILYASVVFLIWLSAKIYRVGIFMYGKKPTFKELIRWAKYK